MSKIKITIAFGIILLVGMVTAISLSNYSKVSEKTSVETKGICNEKECDKNTPSNISLENSGLKLDVLRDAQTGEEILNIHAR